MKKIARRILKILSFFGVDVRKLFINIKGIGPYIKDYFKYRKYNKNFPVNFYPILDDKVEQSGTASGHYFHQDLLVAQLIFKNTPEVHVDVGSRVDGFVSNVASFRRVVVMDIRNLDVNIDNIEFMQADMMKLDKKLHKYCDSLSSLHALEHFGLGRYGDPIDVNGYIKGFNNMATMVKKEGRLYLSVPIGPQRVEFNAHRVFNIKTIINLYKDQFTLLSFSYVNDAGDLFQDQTLSIDNVNNNFNCYYGCGIFEMKKNI
jgi:hypothetical protein